MNSKSKLSMSNLYVNKNICEIARSPGLVDPGPSTNAVFKPKIKRLRKMHQFVYWITWITLNGSMV